MPKIYS